MVFNTGIFENDMRMRKHIAWLFWKMGAAKMHPEIAIYDAKIGVKNSRQVTKKVHILIYKKSYNND